MPRIGPRNPLAVLLVTAGFLVPVFLSFDAVTPLAFLALGIVHLALLGGVDFRDFLKTLAALSIVSAGLFALNVLFPAEGVNGLWRGTCVFLRSVCLISLSIGFIYAVNPYDLFRSFMVNLRLPPRIGYALFAGWNTIPLLRRDLGIIERAQAARFGARKRKARDRLRVAVPLLAGAVRHGERAALSMAARGMENPGNRTYIRESRWTRTDTAYCVLGLLASVAAFLPIIRGGFFIFELG